MTSDEQTAAQGVRLPPDTTRTSRLWSQQTLRHSMEPIAMSVSVSRILPDLRDWARRRMAGASSWQSRVAWVLGLAVVYFLAESLASRFTMPGTFIAVIWPASGIAVAVGIMVGPWTALGVLLADALYSTAALGDVSLGLTVAAGNALQAFVIAWAIRRAGSAAHPLATPLSVVRYTLLAALAGTMTSSTIGVAALAVTGTIQMQELAASWLAWYASDVVSMLLIPPFILVWRFERPPRSPGAERAAFLAILAVVTMAVAILPRGSPRFAFAILSLPLITWAAFRFGGRYVVGTTLGLGAAAAVGLARGLNEVSVGSFLEVQMFVGAAAVTGLVVSAAVRRERERLKIAAEHGAGAVSEARDRLLSSFAHELNNPLTPILLNLDLLANPRLDDARRAQALRVIERNAVRLSKLVADLKEVSVLQSRRAFRLHPVPTDLVSVASAAIDSYRAAAANAGVRLVLEAPESVEARADADRIMQVLSNLLTNAFKYTPSGRSIVVKVASSPTRASICVQDEGVGMTRAQIEKLFAPFVQVQEAGVQKEGTGLGLYIARGIVEAHGGSLSCESDGPGHGSRFTLDLPVDCGERALAASVQPAPARGTSA